MLKKSEFARNSLTLILGTGIAQLIPIALQPVIRRMFTDQEFGVFAQYFSVVSILALVANLTYGNAIVIPKSDKSALNLLAGSIFLSFGFSLLSLLALFTVGPQFFDWIGFSPDLESYYWLIPISVFLVSVNLAFGNWLTRKKYFKGLAYNKAARRGAEGSSRILFGTVPVPGGLFFGTLIGDIFNSFMFLFQFKKSEGSFKEVSKTEIKKVLKEQNEFPKFALFPQLLNVVSSFLPVFLLSAMYDKSIVGQFDGSREILAAPLALISLSISQVLYQKIVEDTGKGLKISRLMRNNALLLMGLGIVGIAIFYPFGVPLFEFIFGSNWTLSGELSSILVFSYAIRFVVSPLSISLVALKKLKIAAVWQVGYFLLTLNLLWLDKMSVQEFLTYFVIIDVFAYSVYGLIIFLTVKKQDQSENIN